ncbi:MAG: hypothetical protein K2X93_26620 [Candidatus Obscuribacterales bacterium]|nr:hypothetical protein [Candidatus Obscuribacterales bacterium]
MDTLFFIIAIVVSVLLLLAIAMPERLLPDVPNKKKKTVGSSHWGVYSDSDATQSVGEVEVKPLASTQRTVYGATTYAKGKGVKRGP